MTIAMLMANTVKAPTNVAAPPATDPRAAVCKPPTGKHKGGFESAS